MNYKSINTINMVHQDYYALLQNFTHYNFYSREGWKCTPTLHFSLQQPGSTHFSSASSFEYLICGYARHKHMQQPPFWTTRVDHFQLHPVNKLGGKESLLSNLSPKLHSFTKGADSSKPSPAQVFISELALRPVFTSAERLNGWSLQYPAVDVIVSAWWSLGLGGPGHLDEHSQIFFFFVQCAKTTKYCHPTLLKWVISLTYRFQWVIAQKMLPTSSWSSADVTYSGKLFMCLPIHLQLASPNHLRKWQQEKKQATSWL